MFFSSKNVNISDDDKGSVWKQLLMSFLASIPFLTHGVETTALSSSAHSGHFISTGEVTWSTTALIIAAGMSAPVYCYLVDKFGRKAGVYGVSMMQGASCIPLFLPPTEASLIVLHVLAGLSSGGLFTVLPMYIREVSDSNRAVCVAVMMVMTTAGYLTKIWMEEEAVMFLMVALVAAQFLSMLVLVESPSYLVKVGKNDIAKTNIAKLKCLAEDHAAVTVELTELKNESDRAKASGNLNIIRILKNRIYRDIFKIGVVLYTVTIICGSVVFLDQDKALLQLKSTLDPNKSLVLYCLFAGSLFTVVFIRFLERRYLLTASYAVMVLSMAVLAVYTQSDLTVASLRSVPVVSLGILVFTYDIAWGLPVVIMVEMLNLEIRATLLGILYAYSQMLKLAHVHSFQYIEAYMGLYTIFYIFACINLFGGVYSLFAIPDIKGNDVRQIEKQLKRVPLIQFKTIKV